MTSGPNYNEDPDTEGKTVPPYEGRTKSGEVGAPEESRDAGSRTGGATGPSEADTDVEDPADTPRGEHASPADEQPAAEASETAESAPGTSGPTHQPGTGRAEDKP
jgi:hypothetical protein